MDITSLPKDILELILLRTSPGDVIRSSAVCKHFFSASESDVVWDNFLPVDCQDIISQSCFPVPPFASKKHMFHHLCHTPIFLHNNTQSFALDKWRGKKCYTLGARALHIAWGNGDTPWYWDFVSIPDSSFPVVAKLSSVWWLEIKGKIHAKQLSPHTTYGAFLVFKMMPSINFSGFDTIPVKVTVLEVDEEDEGPPRNNNHAMTIKSFYLLHSNRVNRAPGEMPVDQGDAPVEMPIGWGDAPGEINVDWGDGLVEMHIGWGDAPGEINIDRGDAPGEMHVDWEDAPGEMPVDWGDAPGEMLVDWGDALGEMPEDGGDAPGEMPVDRGDGWMEVDMGRYHVGDIDSVGERAVVEMTLWEVEGLHCKSGLLVHSIDLRPLD